MHPPRYHHGRCRASADALCLLGIQLVEPSWCIWSRPTHQLYTSTALKLALLQTSDSLACPWKSSGLSDLRVADLAYTDLASRKVRGACLVHFCQYTCSLNEPRQPSPVRDQHGRRHQRHPKPSMSQLRRLELNDRRFQLHAAAEEFQEYILAMLPTCYWGL